MPFSCTRPERINSLACDREQYPSFDSARASPTRRNGCLCATLPSLFSIVKSKDYSSVFARPSGSEGSEIGEPSPTRAASSETLKSAGSQAGREMFRFTRLTDISQRDLRSARNRRLRSRRSAVHVGNCDRGLAPFLTRDGKIAVAVLFPSASGHSPFLIPPRHGLPWSSSRYHRLGHYRQRGLVRILFLERIDSARRMVRFVRARTVKRSGVFSVPQDRQPSPSPVKVCGQPNSSPRRRSLDPALQLTTVTLSRTDTEGANREHFLSSDPALRFHWHTTSMALWICRLWEFIDSC